MIPPSSAELAQMNTLAGYVRTLFHEMGEVVARVEAALMTVNHGTAKDCQTVRYLAVRCIDHVRAQLDALDELTGCLPSEAVEPASGTIAELDVTSEGS